jgi:hypothetical protein
MWSVGSRSINSRACAVVGCSKFTDTCSEVSRSINSRACAVVGCSKVTEMWSQGSRSINNRACAVVGCSKLTDYGPWALGKLIVAHAQS